MAVCRCGVNTFSLVGFTLFVRKRNLPNLFVGVNGKLFVNIRVSWRPELITAHQLGIPGNIMAYQKYFAVSGCVGPGNWALVRLCARPVGTSNMW